MQSELADNVALDSAVHGQAFMADVHPASIDGWTVMGAPHLVLPKSGVDRPGLSIAGQTRTTLAGGTARLWQTVKQLSQSFKGRDDIFELVVQPNLQDVRTGAIGMDKLDRSADPIAVTCIPRGLSVIIT